MIRLPRPRSARPACPPRHFWPKTLPLATAVALWGLGGAQLSAQDMTVGKGSLRLGGLAAPSSLLRHAPTAMPAPQRGRAGLSLDSHDGLGGFGQAAQDADPTLLYAAFRKEIGAPLIPQAEAAPQAEAVPAPPVALQRPSAKAELSEGSLNTALTWLAVMAGPSNFAPLVAARAGEDTAIYITGGTADLATLAKAGLPGLYAVEDGVVVERPLVLWNDAALRMAPGETLYLSRAAGAFVLAFGTLELQGATIASTRPVNPHLASYEPFVTVAGQGVLLAEHAAFIGLGAQGSTNGTGSVGTTGMGAIAGLSISSGLLYHAEETSRISESQFLDVAELRVEGVDGFSLTDSQFEGRTREGVVLRNLAKAEIRNVAFRTTGSASALELAGLRQSRIEQNSFAAGSGGILVSGGSQALRLRQNMLLKPLATGLEIRDSRCVLIEQNLVVGAGTTALRLNHADAVTIHQNGFLQARTAAVELVDMAAGGLSLSDNLIAHNREGLRGDRPARLHLQGNRLAAQFPRLMSGPVASQQPAWLAAQKAHTALSLTTPTAAPSVAPSCEGI
ncbi:right-handed parallel beta-helix repeat-containing protein [Thioclava sp. GXIMD4215]|uniref:right-handed parallel beta-helix repeat-containing protein n=1 Tax=Thioclava sp. GXIMD4215 TaxID=3131928 RepID=UPI0032435F64